MTEETRLRLIEKASCYDIENFDLFYSEFDWEEWMEEYTEAEDGETITPDEETAIDMEIADIFMEAHGLCKEDIVEVVYSKECCSCAPEFDRLADILANEREWVFL